MPIYAYRCESCGFNKDVLQKMSDAPLTECPSCAQHSFKKQLTAPGFQLKGTGWYATDFRNNGASAPTSTPAPAEAPCAASASCGTSCPANADSAGTAA